MSEHEDFTGGSSYTTGGECDADYHGAGKHDESNAPQCSQTMNYFLGGLVVVLLILFILALTDTAGLKLPERLTGKKDDLTIKVEEDKDRLTVKIEEDERMRSRFLSDGQYSTGQAQTDADIQARTEVHGSMNNVAMDPAVQRIVGGYSDFTRANNPVTEEQRQNARRKGTNQADAGGNRFAGSESHANQEGSLWQKPVEKGSFVERMGGKEGMSAGSHNDWTGRYSEAHLDPNRVYVENNSVGQPMYSWGLSPARGPRGKTDLLLGAAAAGL